MNKAVDSIQQRLTDYACRLNYEDLPVEVIHAARLRVIDTLGVLMGGFFGEPGSILRSIAATMPNSDGATVIGTRLKTTPDMAAFVNAATMRYTEFSDVNHGPGTYHAHPSDVITPLLAVAEHAQRSGRDFITSVVLAYEVYTRIADVFVSRDFDHTNLCCVSTAVAAGKLLGLTPDQLAHCISMAVVPNNTLTQARGSHKSMYKVVVSGQAGRAGVFAALLARAGMEGPHLPFEGKAGWCDHVAGQRFSLDTMGGNGTRFKILDTRIRHRSAMGETHSSIFAAEKLAPALKNVEDVKQVIIEVYKRAKDLVGTREHDWCWDPQSRESADNGIPYVVAATLIDGTINPRSFNDAHLWNPQLRALMQKIEIVENNEFTAAFDLEVVRDDPSLNSYARLPREHRTRITVVTGSGERLVAQAGGDVDDISVQKHDAQIEEKFRGLTEDVSGTKRVHCILERLWHLDELANVNEIPPAFEI